MMYQGGAPTRQTIVELLATNDRAVARAVHVLWLRQTADEQQVGVTKHQNARGFNQADGSPGAADGARMHWRGELPADRVAFWRQPQGSTTRIAKYAGQLLEIALEKWAARQLEIME